MSQVPAAEPVIGTTIDGKYRVDSLMGKGGMGKVFRVTHVQLNKTFALKLMNFTQDDADPNRLARFKREAEALAKINHPNVVMVTDFGITPEQVPYIVMEFIEGVALRNLLEKMGKLSEKQSILIAKQMCAGLHAAHIQGIIHRDLKPENIMIQQLADEEIMARVLDFGIAKVLQSDDPASQNLTSNEELLGTLKYMTPEQFLGSPVDARSDVFGICLITYEMLTGIVAPAVMSLAQPLHELRPDISPRLSEIVLRGLAQSPDQRHQSALELKRDFENLEQSSLLESAISIVEKSSDSTVLSSGSNPTNSGRIGITGSHSKNPTLRTNVGNAVTISNAPEPKSIPVNISSSIDSENKGGKGKFIAIFFVVLLIIGGIGAWQFAPQIKQLTSNASPTPKLDPAATPATVVVKGGTFKMGTNKGDKYASPEHAVDVETFSVSKFLVTNRQYAEFVKQANYASPSFWQGSNPPPEILEQAVTSITWLDANAYCRWLSQQTGKAYRMVTEKEWEYLARNRSQINVKVEEIMDKYNEWTDTEVYLYPKSTTAYPTLKAGERYRIFRGVNNVDAGMDPITFRNWDTERFSASFLGFRVACKATTE